MITITIDGKPYRAVYRWGDLTLGKFIELSQIEIPDKLIALYVSSTSMNTEDPGDKKKALARYTEASEAILPEDFRKHFPVYYGKVIGVLSDIPPEVIDRMDADLRVTLYNNYLRGFVLSLVFNVPVDIVGGKVVEYTPPEVSSFELNGERFLFPVSLKIGEDTVPMAKESILSFAEASDIDLAIQGLQDEGVKKYPMLMAVYCRKEGEPYQEEKVLEREKLFLTTPMDTAWSLFFCIGELTTELLSSSASFSREAVLQVVKNRVASLTSESVV